MPWLGEGCHMSEEISVGVETVTALRTEVMTALIAKNMGCAGANSACRLARTRRWV
jgi:hypothetical protein